ncbi:OPA3-domain-containing protein [Neoconidiobolus thromboides FSU 785]|nr:OPA3-domain-containing protein [Neoconidiobolus thromboides FSU 785]
MATLKLGALVVRTLAKPVANSLKNQTKNSDLFKSFCIGIAQSYHRIDMKLKMNFLGYEKERIRPLSDSRAVELGSNFLSEFLIFSVAAGIIGYEAYRSKVNASTRKVYVDDAIDDFKSHYDEYQLERKKNHETLIELQKQVHQLSSLNEINTKLLYSFINSLNSNNDKSESSKDILKEVEKAKEALDVIEKQRKELLDKDKKSEPKATVKSKESLERNNEVIIINKKD